MNQGLCGADTPVRETLEAKTTNGRVNAMVAAVTGVVAAFVAALREIFDESAYERFLERSRLDSSVKAYATFQQENEQSMSRRPRCC